MIPFRDRAGTPCSIQASSIADRNCLWIGPDSTTARAAARLHLDQDGAAGLVAALKSLATIVLNDVYDGVYQVDSPSDDPTIRRIRMIRDMDGNAGHEMILGRRLLKDIEGILHDFVNTGILSLDGIEEAGDEN